MPADADKMKRNKRRGIKVVAVAAALVVAGGAAFAYWTAGGSGQGTATSDDALSALTVVQNTQSNDLAPGVSATLGGKFNNPNSGPAYVTTVTAVISSVVDSSNNPIVGGCANDYVLTVPSVNVGADVAIGNAQGSWSGITVRLNDTSFNQDACKGATVKLTYTAS